MKQRTIIILALLSLAGYLYLSSVDYEMAREDAQVENRLRQEAELVRAADSLGLEGQAWLDFVNRED